MYTNFPLYPTEIFTVTDYPVQTDNTDTVYAALINALRAEMQACFDELGVLPKGDSASVAARFTAIEALSRGRVFSPVSQWKMNDDAATTNVIDSVGTNTGTAQQNTEDITAAGKINKALTFNGSSDYNGFGRPVSLDIHAAITIASWVKPTGDHYNAYGGIWWDSSCLRNRILIENSGAALAQFYIDGVLKTPTAPVSSVPLNEWTHIAMTYNGSEIVLYINGVKQTPISATGDITSDNSGYKRIGKGAEADYYFNGSIDDVRIYNFALLGDEVKALYNLENGTEEKNPVIY